MIATRCHSYLICCFLIAGAAGLAACAGSRTVAVDVSSTDELIGYLRGEGITLMPTGPVTGPGVSEPGESFSVPGGTLYVYEYESSAAATLDAGVITTNPPGPGPSPYFFRNERIIAVYAGTDPFVRNTLADVLGPMV